MRRQILAILLLALACGGSDSTPSPAPTPTPAALESAGHWGGSVLVDSSFSAYGLALTLSGTDSAGVIHGTCVYDAAPANTPCTFTASQQGAAVALALTFPWTGPTSWQCFQWSGHGTMAGTTLTGTFIASDPACGGTSGTFTLRPPAN